LYNMVIVVKVYCCIHGHRGERLLLYTWSSLWTSTVVYMVIVVNVYCCIHGHRCERLLLYTWSLLWTSTVVYMVIVVNVYCCYMVIVVNIYCCDDQVYNSRRSQRWPCIQQLTFTTMTMYTTVDVHNTDYVYNSRRSQRWPCIQQ
jgi:CDP-diglyceride synthetase